jgi:hypothetical protein
MKKTKTDAPVVEATAEVKIEKRGRKVSETSARQMRLKRFAKMTEAGIPVRRGRYAKDTPKVV